MSRNKTFSALSEGTGNGTEVYNETTDGRQRGWNFTASGGAVYLVIEPFNGSETFDDSNGDGAFIIPAGQTKQFVIPRDLLPSEKCVITAYAGVGDDGLSNLRVEVFIPGTA